MNNCKECIHAEMCKWIDELDGRGCDFYDGKPCELLILKSDILLHQDDRKKWAESIKQEKAKGLIILPPYFTPVLVPDDVEIQIEQEPCETTTNNDEPMTMVYPTIFCEDTISRAEALEQLEQAYNIMDATDRVKAMPSVQAVCEDAISRSEGRTNVKNKLRPKLV